MNKQCNIVQDMLPLYVDGACSEATAEMVKEHLETCAECNSIYQQMLSDTSEDILRKEKEGIIERHEKAENKKHRRKTIISVALSVVLCFAVVFAWFSLKPVKIDYGTSEVYSQDDMTSAVELIKEQVNSWDGCKLYSISYTNDGLSERELDYCNEIAADGVVYSECMVFQVSFRSPIFGGGAWNANFVYDWTWYLARTENGTWEPIMWGVA